MSNVNNIIKQLDYDAGRLEGIAACERDRGNEGAAKLIDEIVTRLNGSASLLESYGC